MWDVIIVPCWILSLRVDANCPTVICNSIAHRVGIPQISKAENMSPHSQKATLYSNVPHAITSCGSEGNFNHRDCPQNRALPWDIHSMMMPLLHYIMILGMTCNTPLHTQRPPDISRVLFGNSDWNGCWLPMNLLGQWLRVGSWCFLKEHTNCSGMIMKSSVALLASSRGKEEKDEKINQYMKKEQQL